MRQRADTWRETCTTTRVLSMLTGRGALSASLLADSYRKQCVSLRCRWFVWGPLCVCDPGFISAAHQTGRTSCLRGPHDAKAIINSQSRMDFWKFLWHTNVEDATDVHAFFKQSGCQTKIFSYWRKGRAALFSELSTYRHTARNVHFATQRSGKLDCRVIYVTAWLHGVQLGQVCIFSIIADITLHMFCLTSCGNLCDLSP